MGERVIQLGPEEEQRVPIVRGAVLHFDRPLMATCAETLEGKEGFGGFAQEYGPWTWWIDLPYVHLRAGKQGVVVTIEDP